MRSIPDTRPRRLLCAVACLLAIAGCAPRFSDGPIQSLATAWAFHPGDDPRWADPDFDDSAWPRLTVPLSWGRQGYPDVYGIAWYRVRLPASWPAEEPVGITIGKVASAYEIFAGGRRIGGVGRMPPGAEMQYDRHGTYAIPASARSADGTIQIALRVWRAEAASTGSAGPDEGPFEAGPLADIVQRAALAEVAELALVIVFLFTAAYHIVLGLLHPGADEYEWFGLLVLETALYGFLRTQWKYELSDNFLAFKKLEHMLLYVLQATALQFIWVYFRLPRPRWGIYLQGPMLLLAITVLVTPGLGVALTLVPLMYVLASLVAVIGLVTIVGRVRAGDTDARLLGVGLVSLVIALAHDALVERNLYFGPRLGLYGFAVLVLIMGLSLVLRFRRAVIDLDTLRLELENRVDVRTRELTDAYREMEELALRDGLTRLLNRRALQERAMSDLATAKRKGRPFALAMVDIDHFKVVNDTHGHAAGDEVLAQIARRLASGVRSSDDVGRWGGEEFLVLFPESDADSALAAAERLRVAIEAEPIRVEGDIHLHLTVSVGVAVIAEAVPSALVLDSLIRLADDALYRAKAAGRNRVIAA